jgi:hypothetical protein
MFEGIIGTLALYGLATALIPVFGAIFFFLIICPFLLLKEASNSFNAFLKRNRPTIMWMWFSFYSIIFIAILVRSL